MRRRPRASNSTGGHLRSAKNAHAVLVEEANRPDARRTRGRSFDILDGREQGTTLDQARHPRQLMSCTETTYNRYGQNHSAGIDIVLPFVARSSPWARNCKTSCRPPAIVAGAGFATRGEFLADRHAYARCNLLGAVEVSAPHVRGRPSFESATRPWIALMSWSLIVVVMARCPCRAAFLLHRVAELGGAGAARAWNEPASPSLSGGVNRPHPAFAPCAAWVSE